MFLPSAASPTDYQFPITHEIGQKLVSRSDGSVDVVDLTGAVVGTIGVPWAIDAQGRKHATWYSIEQAGPTSTNVTQHIRPDADAAYPILADPTAILPGGTAPAPAPDPTPYQPYRPQPSTGSGAGSGSLSGSGSGSGSGSRGSSSGSGSGSGTGGSGGGSGPPGDGTSTDPGFSRDYDLNRLPGGGSTPGFGGAKIDDGSGSRSTPSAGNWDVPKLDFSTPPATTGGAPLFGFNPFTGNTTLMGIKFNAWDTIGGLAKGLGDIAKGVGKAVDGIGDILKPKPTPTTPTAPSAGNPTVPGTGEPIAPVIAGAAAVIALIGLAAWLAMPKPQQQAAIRELSIELNRWYNNARDRILGPATPNTKPKTTPGNPAVPATPTTPVQPFTPPAAGTPPTTVLPSDPGTTAPFTTPGGGGSVIGTPTRPGAGTQAPAVPANPATTSVPGGNAPNNDDDDPDKDKDRQTYPAGGIIGAGLGGAVIETPGLPTTPNTTPGAGKPPTFDPTPPPGTAPGTSTDDPRKPDPNKTPDQSKPVETTPGTGTNTAETGGGGGKPDGTKSDSATGTNGSSGAETTTPGKETPDKGGNRAGSTSGDPSGSATSFSEKELATAAALEVYSDEIATAAGALQKEAAAQTKAELEAAQQRLIKQGHEGPATIATVTALGPLLAERDQQSWDMADKNLEQIAQRLGVPVEQLAVSDEVYQYPISAIPTNAEHSPLERLRELRQHLKWMNSQTFEETTDKMDNPKRSSSDVTKARQDFQNDWTVRSFKSLVEMGYTPEQAEKLSASIVERLMKRLVITHNPDMVAGGPADLLITFGDKRTNSSLGPTHRAAAAAYRQWLDAQKAKNPNAIVRVDFPGYPLLDPPADDETDD